MLCWPLFVTLRADKVYLSLIRYHPVVLMIISHGFLAVALCSAVIRGLPLIYKVSHRFMNGSVK